ncbi:MAG: glutathione S-transferase C-terminal domain-containing protein [Lachnospiraceae bacterium]|nr:glutathione S-transferase C-terminal domain-containing protein [Lachnospiraceae bacterium]
MGNACDIGAQLLKNYTDEEAEQHAQEVGVDPRPKETISEIDARGAFIRQPNAFIASAGDGEGQWKPEAGRYAIYWAHGCHWSNRPVIVRDILGLQDVIKDVAVTKSGQRNVYGHGFGDQPGHKDRLTGAYFLSEFYKRADPDFKGRATTPTLVDIIEKKAVNNDYHRLTNYIEVNFRPFQKPDAPDLYPVALRKEIDDFNDRLFPHINNSHYRMAFCQSYEAYQEAYDDFFESLDLLEEHLSKNRFIFGDFITDSDVRLYVTLVRWETSYFHNVGPLKKRITEYPNIWGYVKDLFAIPEFKKYTFFEFPKATDDALFQGYLVRIAPQIDFAKAWETDGSRKNLSSHPDELYAKHPEGETVEDYITPISTTIWNSPEQDDRQPKNVGPLF